jgi:chromosome segregation ATPase
MDPMNQQAASAGAEEKLRIATAAWEAERARLNAQIHHLETAVADAIARASNPLRLVQSAKEEFELELNRVAKEKTELEQAFLRAKTQWEQEKLKMTGEMVKLRRAAQIMGRPIPKDDGLETNPRIKSLEDQLKAGLEEWNAERERLVGRIQKLEEASRDWDAERRQLHDHAAQLQQAFMQAQARLQSYEIAAQDPGASEAQIDELRRENESLQRQLREHRNLWDAERAQLNSEIERLRQQLQRMSDTRVSKEVVEQLRLQYEQKLQEAIEQKTQLAQELQSASVLLESERARLSAAHKSSTDGFDRDAIEGEIARVEGMLNEIVSVIDNPATALSTVIRKNVEKAELDAYLKGILFALGKK